MSSLDAASLFGVKGLVAVITGGGTGIGLMMAKALEHNGAKVYIIGRRLETLQAAAKEASHGNIIPIQGDVTSKEDLLRAVDIISKSEGYINVLIANSGITGPTSLKMPPNPSLTQFRDFLWETDVTTFTKTMEVNTSAVHFCILAFLELLAEGNKKKNVEQLSQIIAVSSIGGFHRLALAGFSYAASKAATTHMMKQFSNALVPYNIRSNVVAPGIYPSEMASGANLNAMLKGSADGEISKSIIPLQKVGTEEDMAGAVLYLTSKAGGYLNGNVIVTDGGRLAVLPSTY